MQNTRLFRDISLVFAAHPMTNDVVTKIDAAAVKQSIRNLVMTMNYERPFHPEKGCQIYGMLFENVTSTTLNVAKQSIVDVITQYEPRANLVDVVIEDALSNNAINISIYFTLLNIDVVESVSAFIDRLR